MPHTYLGKILMDLKETPAWLVLCLLFALVWVHYSATGDLFAQRVIDTFAGALIGVLIGRVKDVIMDRRAASTTVTGDVINVQPETKPKEEQEEVQE